MSISEFVRTRRKELKQTQTQMAEASGAHYTLVSSLEQGRRKFLQQKDIPILAKALAISEDDVWALLPAGSKWSRYFPVNHTNGTAE